MRWMVNAPGWGSGWRRRRRVGWRWRWEIPPRGCGEPRGWWWWWDGDGPGRRRGGERRQPHSGGLVACGIPFMPSLETAPTVRAVMPLRALTRCTPLRVTSACLRSRDETASGAWPLAPPLPPRLRAFASLTSLEVLPMLPNAGCGCAPRRGHRCPCRAWCGAAGQESAFSES